MHGWMGKIIRTNLTDEIHHIELLNMNDAKTYLGGRGLGEKTFLNEVDLPVDALSPKNKLIFMTGPLTGTLASCEERYAVVSRSPLSGKVAAFNCGGHWGSELKYAGYDGIILEGKAEKPLYLYINDDQIELRDAAHLWGKDMASATDDLKKDTSEDIKVVCIGPDGEKQISLSSIMDDQCPGTGCPEFGAIMGSKNLKAIVVRGTKSVTVAKRMEFLKSCIQAKKSMNAFSSAVSYDCLTAVRESVGIFPFNQKIFGLHEIAEMFRTGTGFEYTDSDIIKLGERILDLEQYSV